MAEVKIKPMADRLQTGIMTVRESIAELLMKSSLYYRDDSGDGVVFIGPRYHWEPLAPEQLGVQQRLMRSVEQWFALANVIAADAPRRMTDKLTEAKRAVNELVTQENSQWSGDLNAKAARLWHELDELMLLLRSLDPRPGVVTLLVPDTNALIYNPAVEDWRFADLEPFQLVLTPSVLSELDELKEGRSGQPRAEKAARVIRQVKEYRRRGNVLHVDGAPLRKGISSLRMMATEPRMDLSLPWLDASVNDDRVLAAFLEIARDHIASPSAIVTRDINLQNKASLALVDAIEPPDPPAENKQ